MTYESERLRILEMIDHGLISPGDGIKLLNALQGGDESPPISSRAGLPADFYSPTVDASPEVEAQAEPQVSVEDLPGNDAPPYPEMRASIDRWRSWWWIPMWIGIAVTVASGILMVLAWQAGGYSFWFACSWFPFLLGVAVMALAWSSRTARWLHVRVHQPAGRSPEKIAISVPLPLRLTAWFFRTFGHRIPNMQNTSIDEIIMALEHTSRETPFYVEVTEGANGERVEVFIG